MRRTRREVLGDVFRLGLLGGAGALSPLAAPAARAEWTGGGVRSASHSLIGTPRYGDRFDHFDFVNVAAPRDGRLAYMRIGRYEHFNRYNRIASPAVDMFYVFDRLMESSLDEGSTHYAWLAEWMEVATDNSWTAFKIRDAARWHDGRPVAATDLIKSFELLTTDGAPFYAAYYADVDRLVDEGDNIVRFHFKTNGNKELPHILGQLTVFPAHWWEERDFTAPLLEPPLGSGPYRVADFELGRSVTLERVDDYWGHALPVCRGMYNAKTLHIDYFTDTDVAFEAFQAGQLDYWRENTARRWASRYDFPAVLDGRVIKREIALDGPKAVQGFVLNQRRKKFQDVRVRAAFAMAYDFEWTNRSIYFNQYNRPLSFFQGSTALMATGTPEGRELALLEPHRDALPPALFEEPFAYPVTDGGGQNRRQLREARRLLAEAGYRAQNGVLVDAEGAALSVEFLSRSANLQPSVQPYLDTLSRIGIETRFTVVEPTLFVRRRNNYDFDMIIDGWRNSESPGNEQREYWGSAVVDEIAGRNVAGVQDPVVDALIDVIATPADREELEAATRALDRVLLWGHHALLQLYVPFERVAYWSHVGAPDPGPTRDVGWPKVWWRET